ncbi:hypothetical protein GYMC10_0678 [Paenibacillus sp. Y412MC10]|nr:hypothetical protein GYMC10_0678 [Paenibacillus sp. Y412MC10]
MGVYILQELNRVYAMTESSAAPKAVFSRTVLVP